MIKYVKQLFCNHQFEDITDIKQVGDVVFEMKNLYGEIISQIKIAQVYEIENYIDYTTTYGDGIRVNRKYKCYKCGKINS